MKTEQKEVTKSSTEPKTKKEKEKESLAEEMTKSEMDVVTTVFRSYETGLREATILPKVCSSSGKLKHSACVR